MDAAFSKWPEAGMMQVSPARPEAWMPPQPAGGIEAPRFLIRCNSNLGSLM